MAIGKYIGWQVAPIWVGVMSGVLGIVQQVAVLYPPTRDDPFWQHNVFWLCVWIAFIISMFVALWQKHRELTAEKTKQGYPDIKATALKVIPDFGLTSLEQKDDQFWLAVKYRIVNHSPASASVEKCEIRVVTGTGSEHLVFQFPVGRAQFISEKEVEGLTFSEQLTTIREREEKPLIRGVSEHWWYRGPLPVEFNNELEWGSGAETALKHIKEIRIFITDGFGTVHESVSRPPWDTLGRIRINLNWPPPGAYKA